MSSRKGACSSHVHHDESRRVVSYSGSSSGSIRPIILPKTSSATLRAAAPNNSSSSATSNTASIRYSNRRRRKRQYYNSGSRSGEKRTARSVPGSISLYRRGAWFVLVACTFLYLAIFIWPRLDSFFSKWMVTPLSSSSHHPPTTAAELQERYKQFVRKEEPTVTTTEVGSDNSKVPPLSPLPPRLAQKVFPSIPIQPATAENPFGIPRNANNSTTLADPTLPTPRDNVTTIVLVLSARANFERRQAIRETWGSGHCVYFVVGAPPLYTTTTWNHAEPANVQRQLIQEQSEHRDLLDVRFPESYSSLPCKLKLAFQWVVHSPLMPESVRWLLKVDDDTVARVATLERALLRHHQPTVPTVIGNIITHRQVPTAGKWAERRYPHHYYPDFPNGASGYVVTVPIAKYIAALQNPVYYQGEDTSIGIWLDEASSATSSPSMQVTWIRSPYFVNNGKCMDRRYLVIGHQILPDRMRACFSAGDEWPEDTILKPV